jgi:hypothetical protein
MCCSFTPPFGKVVAEVIEFGFGFESMAEVEIPQSAARIKKAIRGLINHLPSRKIDVVVLSGDFEASYLDALKAEIREIDAALLERLESDDALQPEFVNAVGAACRAKSLQWDGSYWMSWYEKN